MFSIFKGSQLDGVSIAPYVLEEVAKEGTVEAPRSIDFKRLHEDQGDEDQTENAPDRSHAAPEAAEALSRERIDRIEKAAYEEAFKQGEKAGAESGERMFRSAVRSFVEAGDQLKRLKQQFYQSIEREVLDLVLATTHKVVQGEVDDRKEMVLDVLKEAASRIMDRERIRVRINPSDFDILQAHKGDIIQALDGIKHLFIEKDARISRGGAIVETDYGTVDATIEQRFAEVENALRRQMGGSDDALQEEPR